MEMLLIIGFCMIVLSVLYGISIYLSAIGFLEKKHLPTTIWLFIFATIVGSYHLMMLCQKRGNTHSYIASSGYGNFIRFHCNIVIISLVKQ